MAHEDAIRVDYRNLFRSLPMNRFLQGYEKEGRKLIYTVVVDDVGSKVNLRHYPAN